MYRDPSFSLEETIVRLEAEVRELRALGGKRRERRLVATTVVSMVIAVHAIIGCVMARVQTERLIHETSRRLTQRTTDLLDCARYLEDRSREVDSCRAELGAPPRFGLPPAPLAGSGPSPDAL